MACCEAVLRDFQHHWLEGTAPLHLRPFRISIPFPRLCVCIFQRPCSSFNAVLVAAPHLSDTDTCHLWSQLLSISMTSGYSACSVFASEKSREMFRFDWLDERALANSSIFPFYPKTRTRIALLYLRPLTVDCLVPFALMAWRFCYKPAVPIAGATWWIKHSWLA